MVQLAPTFLVLAAIGKSQEPTLSTALRDAVRLLLRRGALQEVCVIFFFIRKQQIKETTS